MVKRSSPSFRSLNTWNSSSAFCVQKIVVAGDDESSLPRLGVGQQSHRLRDVPSYLLGVGHELVVVDEVMDALVTDQRNGQQRQRRNGESDRQFSAERPIEGHCYCSFGDVSARTRRAIASRTEAS
jgi:hypothetical protein